MRHYALPAILTEGHPIEKLVWLYVALNGRGEYSARGLAQELGVDKTSTQTALQKLKEKGLLVELSTPLGRRAGCYEVRSEAPDDAASVCDLRPNDSYSNQGTQE